MPKSELSPVQLAILDRLRSGPGGPTVREVADALGLPVQLVSGNLTGLATRDLVSFAAGRSESYVLLEPTNRCPHCRQPYVQEFRLGPPPEPARPAFWPKNPPPLSGAELAVAEAIWRNQRNGHLLTPEEVAKEADLRMDVVRRILNGLHYRGVIQVARLEPAPGEIEKPFSDQGPSFRLLIAN